MNASISYSFAQRPRRSTTQSKGKRKTNQSPIGKRWSSVPLPMPMVLHHDSKQPEIGKSNELRSEWVSRQGTEWAVRVDEWAVRANMSGRVNERVDKRVGQSWIKVFMNHCVLARGISLKLGQQAHIPTIQQRGSRRASKWMGKQMSAWTSKWVSGRASGLITRTYSWFSF